MKWAIYGHLPAGGLGDRDPRRPYVTGGLGAGVFVFLPGPGGEIIVIYGHPVLEYIEAIVPTAKLPLLTGAVNFGTPDLTWVAALDRQATLVRVNTPRDAELIFGATIAPSGLFKVSGDYQAEAAAVLVSAALTGAETTTVIAALEQGDTLEAELTGVFLPDTEASLYAGLVLSSQDS